MSLTIRQIRLAKEIPQQQVADALGVHIQTYRKLENNPELFTVKQAKKVANFFGLSYDEIFFAND